jgi:hypothetical protein
MKMLLWNQPKSDDKIMRDEGIKRTFSKQNNATHGKVDGY